MKLCEECVNVILKSREVWGVHKSYAYLKESSEWVERVTQEFLDSNPHRQVHNKVFEKNERCLFCWTLYCDIEKAIERGNSELKEHKGPIHRWNMRTLARIRESLETVAVTFRQIPRQKKEEETATEEITLPTRTFYLFPEDAISPLPSIQELGWSTNPARKNGGSQIKSWVETCNNTHTSCMKRRKAMAASSSQFYPTRLLDIRGAAGTRIKIVETAKTPVQGPYASLSHCWGPKPQFERLLPENKEEYCGIGVPWEKFTTNFQHAIEVARFLGIPYLWIDSMCIIQGEHGDWGSEAGKMHQVYRNSYCNIALVDSEDDTGGAYRERDPSDVSPVRFEGDDDSSMFGKKNWRVLPGDLWDTQLLSTKLYVRGWVFQERMLAPRILHFASRQVFWDCPSMSACESLPNGLPPPMDGSARPERHWRGRLQEPEGNHEPLAGASDDNLIDFWKTAVDKYTSCKLTKGSDKTIAMWGIAKLVRDAFDSKYGLGLWQENLEDQLTWRVAECELLQRPSESTEWHLERNIPSWSWASMDGRIEVPDRLTQERHYRVTGHSGHPLKFDLVEAKRHLPPIRPKSREGVSPTQTRGMSDTIVELQRRYKELERMSRDSQVVTRQEGEDHEEEIDPNAEPKFRSMSLKIHGHIGRGRLHWDHDRKQWVLAVDGLIGADIDGFPDTVPQPNNPTDQNPYFVVLSAKRKVKPDYSQATDAESGEDDSSDHEDTNGQKDNREFEYFGVGIMMKDSGPQHFRRTGAFSFRNFSADAVAKLLGLDAHKGGGFPPDLFHSNMGQRFWLD